MSDPIELERSDWRVVASAWVLLLLFFLLLAGASAVACPRAQPHPHRHLAGTVIPQHDPCIAAGVPSAQGVDGCASAGVGQIPLPPVGYL